MFCSQCKAPLGSSPRCGCGFAATRRLGVVLQGPGRVRACNDIATMTARAVPGQTAFLAKRTRAGVSA